MRALTDRKVRTLRAQWLGHRLRELRESNGLTLRQVGDYLKRNFSAISRFETAEWPFPRGDVAQLLDLYGVLDGAERARLLQLSEEVWRTDEWVDGYADAIYDRSFCDLPWLERRATRIRAFELVRVPGLLQTPEYAAALIRTIEGPDPSDEQVARWVALRQERQQVIAGARPTPFDAVVTEAALRTVVGGPAVLRANWSTCCASAGPGTSGCESCPSPLARTPAWTARSTCSSFRPRSRRWRTRRPSAAGSTWKRPAARGTFVRTVVYGKPRSTRRPRPRRSKASGRG